MRKITIMILGVMLLFVFSGCSNDHASGDKKGDKASSEQKASSDKVGVDENGNVLLTKVGQKTKDTDGSTYELKKIKAVNQSVDISPVTLTIQDMKIIELTNAPEDYADYLLQFMNKKTLPDTLHYIQISYTAENTANQDIGWNGIQTIVTNTGEQLDALGNDFIWEENGFDGTFYGKTKHEGVIGVFTKSNPDEIDSLKFIISSSFNDDFEDITAEQQAIFTF